MIFMFALIKIFFQTSSGTLPQHVLPMGGKSRSNANVDLQQQEWGTEKDPQTPTSVSTTHDDADDTEKDVKRVSRLFVFTSWSPCIARHPICTG